MNHKYLIVIGGATATGKTAFAVQLAQHFQTEIVSCDSRQFYREMNIGTAKPTAQEMQDVLHYFIGHLSIFESYNVGDFEREGLILLEKLFQQQDYVVAVGGSGLYIKALCEGLDTFPDVPEAIRQEARQLYAEQGLQGLQQAVQTADPPYFAMVDVQNPHRLIRALEVCLATGLPFSSFRKQVTKTRFFTPIYIQLDLSRAELYDRINRRVDDMMEEGLLQEVQTLFPYRNLTALQTVGYQELFDSLENKIDLQEAVNKIKQNTRNYAKRQLTWFRRNENWKKFSSEDLETVLQYIYSISDRVRKIS